MHKASFSEVIEVMLIILLIYFGLKLIFRLLGPLLLKFILKRVGKQFEKKFGQFDPAQKQQKEKEVSISKRPKKKGTSNKDVGEYIDYEEID